MTRSSGSVLLVVVLGLGVVAMATLLLAQQTALGSNAHARWHATDQAQYAAEAALVHAKWAANQSSCNGYALPATPFGDATYSATFAPLRGSPVAIRATATLPDGTSARASVSEQPVFDLATTLPVIAPDATAGKDTEIDAWLLDQYLNWGADPRMRISGLHRGLMQFDVSAVPPQAQVTSAKLRLYQSSGSALEQQIQIRSLTTAWVEGDNTGEAGSGASWRESDAGVTWSSGGGDLGPGSYASVMVSDTVGWVEFELRDLVQQWVAGDLANDGFALLPQGFPGYSEFETSDTSDQTKLPNLTISYRCQCDVVTESGTLILQPGSLGGLDVTLDADQPSRNFGAAGTLSVSGGDAVEQHALLQFDLRGLPVNARIDSAELEVYGAAESTNNGVVGAYRMTSAWAEGSGSALGIEPPDGASWYSADASTTWGQPGGDAVSAPAATASVPNTTERWYTFDIADLTASWHGGQHPNHGVLLRRTSGRFTRLALSSSEGASNPPRLTIAYSCGCGGCAVVTPPATDLVLTGDAPSDDAEEAFGLVVVNDTQLELTEMFAVPQLVGLRFPNVALPQAASILSAQLEFTAAAASAAATTLTLDVEASDDALPFQAALNDLSDRTTQPMTISWGAVEQWPAVDGVHRSPDFKDQLQMLVDRPGWNGGNALAVLIGGTGVRTAYAIDGDAAKAPRLLVSYLSGSGNAAPPGYRDEFAQQTCNLSVDYAGSDGSLDWGTVEWIETGDDNNPCSGNAALQSAGPDFELALTGDVEIERPIDLSLVAQPYWKVEYRRSLFNGLTSAAVFDAWDAGTGTWQEVGRIDDAGTDSRNQDYLMDLSSYATSDGRLRIRSEGIGAFGSQLTIDDVHVYPGDGSLVGGESCLATFVDEFTNPDYDGSDGIVAWNSVWVEEDDDGDPDRGDVRLTDDLGSQRLRLEDKSVGVIRALDLSDYTAALFQFDWRRESYDDANDRVTLEVSTDRANWTTLAVIAGPGTDADYTTTAAIDLAALATRSGFLRFRQYNGGNNDFAYLDNVIVCANR